MACLNFDTKAWFSLGTHKQACAAYPSENGRRHKHHHGNRHFVQMLRRRESGASAITGQTQQLSLCLCCVSFSRDASEREHRSKHKEKEKFLSLCLCVRQPRFYVEKSALMLVLASLVKTRLKSAP